MPVNSKETYSALILWMNQKVPVLWKSKQHEMVNCKRPQMPKNSARVLRFRGAKTAKNLLSDLVTWCWKKLWMEPKKRKKHGEIKRQGNVYKPFYVDLVFSSVSAQEMPIASGAQKEAKGIDPGHAYRTCRRHEYKGVRNKYLGTLTRYLLPLPI